MRVGLGPFAAILAFSAVSLSAQDLTNDPQVYAENYIAFAERHCIRPVVETGAPDVSGLKPIRENDEKTIYREPDTWKDDEALTLEVFTEADTDRRRLTCTVFQGPGYLFQELGQEIVQELARVGRDRIAGYIANNYDVGLAQLVKFCNKDALNDVLRRSPIAGAAISEDGRSVTLVVLGTPPNIELYIAVYNYDAISNCEAS